MQWNHRDVHSFKKGRGLRPR